MLQMNECILNHKHSIIGLTCVALHRTEQHIESRHVLPSVSKYIRYVLFCQSARKPSIVLYYIFIYWLYNCYQNATN